MKASSAKFFTAVALISLATLSTMAQENRVGQFDNHEDIGTPKLAGAAKAGELFGATIRE